MLLEPDIAKVYRSSEAVNKALRELIEAGKASPTTGKEPRPPESVNVPHPDDPDIMLEYDFSNAKRLGRKYADIMAQYGYSYPVFHEDWHDGTCLCATDGPTARAVLQ